MESAGFKAEQPDCSFDRDYVDKALKETLDFLEITLKGQNKVINLEQPDDLRKKVDLEVRDNPCPTDELRKVCQDVLNYQTKPYHPHFHNQLFGGFNHHSLVGAMMTPAINGSIFTYELAPVFTLMQNDLFQHMRTIIGWEEIDGTMCPGGSFANFMGLHLSRSKLHPQFNKEGIHGKNQMKIFSSEGSHYSMFKGAVLCGIGSNNVIKVNNGDDRKMNLEDLRKQLKEQKQAGHDLLIVNSTGGTTVQGAIDPISQIGEICKQFGVWHHVDCAWGGCLLLSPELRPKLGDFKNVDSISFDPHKGPSIPLFATLFLTKHKGLMQKCNSAKADYLFHKERQSYDGSLDVGDKTLQCSRVVDIFKVWTYFKGCGWKGIADQINYQHKLTLFVKDYVEKHDRYQLAVKNVETLNVCFWYIPQKMNKQDFESEKNFYELLSKVTVKAKKFMIDQGKMLCGYSKSKLPYYFWRITMSNPNCTYQQVEQDLKWIGSYCERAYQELTK